MKKQVISKFQNFVDRGNSLICQNIQIIQNLFLGFFDFLATNPYTKLMRLHQPIGSQLVMMPILWVLVVISHNIVHFLCLLIIFTFGAIVMRGVGVIINDIMDKDFDKCVERTKTRPLASGELTIKQAIKLLIILLSVGLFILVLLPLKSIYFGIITMVLIIVYPLVKRYSYYPQIFLGFTFNMGVFIVWFSVEQYISFIPILIYVSAVFWTIGYDTIYAHQDKKDDKKIGVKSTALAFNNKTKEIVKYLYRIVTFSIALAGLNANLNVMFFLIVFLGFFSLSQQIDNVDLDSPEDCLNKFKNNFAYGMLIFFAFTIGCI